MSDFPNTALEAARLYATKGFHVVPVPGGTKGRTADGREAMAAGWIKMRLTVAEIDARFPINTTMNVGLLLGTDVGLTDIDLDTEAAVRAASLLLPSTGAVSGRPGNPRSHYFYHCPDQPARGGHLEFEHPVTKKMIVELRATAKNGSPTMTLAPPSTHPTGDVYSWHGGRIELATRSYKEIERCCRAVAAAALIGMHWPGRHARHDARLALFGGLARGGMAEHEALAFMRAVQAAAGDDGDEQDERDAVRSTYKKLNDDEQFTGWTSLVEHLGADGEAIVRQARAWMFPEPRISGGDRAAPVATPRRKPPPLPWRPFPTHTLPDAAKDLVESAAAAFDCDPAFVALPALAAMAGAIGNSRSVRIKKSYAEPCALWTAAVGYSGDRKSPGLAIATEPLLDLQHDLFDENKRAQETHAEAMREYRSVPKNDRGDEPTDPPPVRQFIIEDSTIEAVGEVLRDNPRGLLVASEELDLWLQSMTRYAGKSGGSDRASWLKLHQGRSLILNRITRERGTLTIRRALASVTGTIQPDILNKALDAAARASGLAARLFLAQPPRRRHRYTEVEVPDKVRERYASLLLGLLSLDPADQEKMRPHALGIEAVAKGRLVEYINDIGGRRYLAGHDEAAVLAKLEGAASRMALVHHVASCLGGGETDLRPVGLCSIEAGVELAEWFAFEWARIAGGLGSTEGEAEARDWYQYIEAKGGTASTRDVQRRNSRLGLTADEAERVLAGLVDLGWAVWVEGSRRNASPAVCLLRMTHDSMTDSDLETEDATPAEDPKHSGSRMTDPTDGAVSAGQALVSAGNSEAAPQVDQNCHAVMRHAVPAAKRSAVIEQEGEADAPAATVMRPAYSHVTDQAGLQMAVAALDETACVGLDLETTGLDPRSDRVRLLTVTTDTIDGGVFTYVVDCFAVDPGPLLEALAGKELIIHNAAFDLGFLRRFGFEPSAPVHDTMLLSRLLYAGADESHTLEDCACRELGMTLDKQEQKSRWAGALREAQLVYAAADAAVLPQLLAALRAKIAAAGLQQAADIETRCLPAVAWVADAGVAIDRNTWQALAREANDEARRLRQELDDAAPRRAGDLFGGGWNWDSPPQTLEALRLAGCDAADTSDATLAGLAHPLAGLLRDYREASKTASSHGEKWLKYVSADGRVRPRWKQLGAATGRMSCGSPNMQQVPRGPHRRCIIAPPGRVLVKADYSQIELRIAAKVSGDTAMLEAYRRGEDLHARTARQVLGVEQVTKADRQLAKALNFGLVFGMGADSFRAYARANYGLDLTGDDAARYRAAFFRSYPGLASWHRRTGRQESVETRTLAGRRRLAVASFMERLNSPVQGTGADGLKLALALMWERRAEVPGAFPVLAVHDEIVVECDAASADNVAAWLKRAMLEAMAPLIAPVPVEVEVKAGTTWGCA